MFKFLSSVLPSQVARPLPSLAAARVVCASDRAIQRQFASQTAPNLSQAVGSTSTACFPVRQPALPTHRSALQATTKLLINGEFRDSESKEWIDVKNPVSAELVHNCADSVQCLTEAKGYLMSQATQEVVTRMPLATKSEFEEAVKAAKDAFPAWKRTPVPHRQRVMLKLQQLIRENMVITNQLRPPGCYRHSVVLR